MSGLAAVWKTGRRSGRARLARAAPTSTARGAIQSQLEDLAYFLRDYADSIDASPGRLQDVEDRLALLDRLKRKHGPTLDDVIAHAAQCERELETLASADERAADVDRELRRAEDDYLGARRGAVRRSGARRRRGLPQTWLRSPRGLAMERLRFEVRFERAGRTEPMGRQRA